MQSGNSSNGGNHRFPGRSGGYLQGPWVASSIKLNEKVQEQDALTVDFLAMELKTKKTELAYLETGNNALELYLLGQITFLADSISNDCRRKLALICRKEAESEREALDGLKKTSDSSSDESSQAIQTKFSAAIEEQFEELGKRCFVELKKLALRAVQLKKDHQSNCIDKQEFTKQNNMLCNAFLCVFNDYKNSYTRCFSEVALYFNFYGRYKGAVDQWSTKPNMIKSAQLYYKYNTLLIKQIHKTMGSWVQDLENQNKDQDQCDTVTQMLAILETEHNNLTRQNEQVSEVNNSKVIPNVCRQISQELSANYRDKREREDATYSEDLSKAQDMRAYDSGRALDVLFDCRLQAIGKKLDEIQEKLLIKMNCLNEFEFSKMKQTQYQEAFACEINEARLQLYLLDKVRDDCHKYHMSKPSNRPGHVAGRSTGSAMGSRQSEHPGGAGHFIQVNDDDDDPFNDDPFNEDHDHDPGSRRSDSTFDKQGRRSPSNRELPQVGDASDPYVPARGLPQVGDASDPYVPARGLPQVGEATGYPYASPFPRAGEKEGGRLYPTIEASVPNRAPLYQVHSVFSDEEIRNLEGLDDSNSGASVPNRAPQPQVYEEIITSKSSSKKKRAGIIGMHILTIFCSLFVPILLSLIALSLLIASFITKNPAFLKATLAIAALTLLYGIAMTVINAGMMIVKYKEEASQSLGAPATEAELPPTILSNKLFHCFTIICPAAIILCSLAVIAATAVSLQKADNKAVIIGMALASIILIFSIVGLIINMSFVAYKGFVHDKDFDNDNQQYANFINRTCSTVLISGPVANLMIGLGHKIRERIDHKTRSGSSGVEEGEGLPHTGGTQAAQQGHPFQSDHLPRQGYLPGYPPQQGYPPLSTGDSPPLYTLDPSFSRHNSPSLSSCSSSSLSANLLNFDESPSSEHGYSPPPTPSH